MKRDPRLIPFSQEHHGALKLSLKLQNAPTDEATAELLLSEREGLLTHFSEEEQLIIPILNSMSSSGALLLQFLNDHRDLRHLLTENDPATYVELGKRLNSHTRFEERELFPAIEAYWAEIEGRME